MSGIEEEDNKIAIVTNETFAIEFDIYEFINDNST